jgi:hypothetical protein
MSSMDVGTEDDEHDARRIRTPWEIQEWAALALLSAIAIVIIAGVASGVVGDTGLNQTSASISEVLLDATRWAGFDVAFLVLAALGLIWWQVDGWAEALDDDRVGGGDDDPGDPDDERVFEEAVRHIGRNRTLATWAGGLLLVTSMAAVGLMVGVVRELSPPSPSMNWQQWISAGGNLLSTLTLAALGGYAVAHIWGLCRTALTVDADTGPALS